MLLSYHLDIPCINNVLTIFELDQNTYYVTPVQNQICSMYYVVSVGQISLYNVHTHKTWRWPHFEHILLTHLAK